MGGAGGGSAPNDAAKRKGTRTLRCLQTHKHCCGVGLHQARLRANTQIRKIRVHTQDTVIIMLQYPTATMLFPPSDDGVEIDKPDIASHPIQSPLLQTPYTSQWSPLQHPVPQQSSILQHPIHFLPLFAPSPISFPTFPRLTSRNNASR